MSRIENLSTVNDALMRELDRFGDEVSRWEAAHALMVEGIGAMCKPDVSEDEIVTMHAVLDYMARQLDEITDAARKRRNRLNYYRKSDLTPVGRGILSCPDWDRMMMKGE